MSIIENIKQINNGIVTAAIYINCDKATTDTDDTEKVITEQLDLMHMFVQSNDIIIVDSHIDRNSTDNLYRLKADAQNYYFDLVLVCNSSTIDLIGSSDIAVIDILNDNYS